MRPNAKVRLMPSAAVISWSCVAARTSVPQRVRLNSSQSSPSTSSALSTRPITTRQREALDASVGAPLVRLHQREPAQQAERTEPLATSAIGGSPWSSQA